MATVLTQADNYKTGSGLNYPVVIKSPYLDYKQLAVRVKVTTGGTIFIGALVIQTTTAANTIDIATDKVLTPWAIVLDSVENKAQLEIDNGAKATKALFFSANSYVWVLPLFPGLVLSVKAILSGGALDAGSRMCCAALGAVRLLAGVATDVDHAAMIGFLVAGYKTNGNTAVYVAMAVR